MALAWCPFPSGSSARDPDADPDEETVEIVGAWQWRRYSPWNCAEQTAPGWAMKVRPNVRVSQYRLEQNVRVEL